MNQRSLLAGLGLVLAALIFIGVNIIAQSSLSSFRFDFTDGKVYSFTDGTRPVFESLEEPIVVRVYYSPALGEVSPPHAALYKRIRDLLAQYSAVSGGLLDVQYFQPEPFSDAEDRAVAFGLQGVPLGSATQVGYFGLAATNSTDDQRTIPFFNLEREAFIEYDLTKLVYNLSNPDRPVVALVSSLPIEGGMPPGMMPGMAPPSAGTPPWTVLTQMREFFRVRTIGREFEEIDEDVQAVFLARPEGLSEQAAYAVDQFLMRGGAVFAFADPNSEESQPNQDGSPDDVSQFRDLLAGWGVNLLPDAVAGDLDAAIRVNAQDGNRPVIADYVAWLDLNETNMDPDSVVTGDIARLVMATSGVIEPAEGLQATFTPLVQTGPQANTLDLLDVQGLPDIVEMFRTFEPGGAPLTLAASVTGPIPSAFDVAPVSEDGEPQPAEHTTVSDGGRLIIVADTDVLSDRFWVSKSNFFGQEIVVPTADNGTFVINALELLTGADALSGLRARSQQNRPFTLVEDIRLEAERQYRATEQALQTRLSDLEAQLDGIQSRQIEAGTDAILSEDDQRAIENYRSELLTTRQDLRNVQAELRADVDRLDATLKLLNIAAVPIVFGLIIFIVSIVGRTRRPKRVIETSMQGES